jgi:hypothetical protein
MKHAIPVSNLPRLAQDDEGDGGGGGGGGGDTGGGSGGRPPLCTSSVFCTKVDFVRLSFDTVFALILGGGLRF